MGFPGGSMVKKLPAMQQERQIGSLGGEDCLEEGMENPLQYSRLGNPWTEEPGGLQSMGSPRVRYD